MLDEVTFDRAVSSTASESRVNTGTFVIVFCSFCISDLLYLMEPSPVHRTMGYRMVCLKNPDMAVPDKHVLGLHVSALQAMLILVACGELKLKSHSFVCVVSEVLWEDNHTLRFSHLLAISGYVLPPFSSLAFWHPDAVWNRISVPSTLSVP